MEKWKKGKPALGTRRQEKKVKKMSYKKKEEEKKGRRNRREKKNKGKDWAIGVYKWKGGKEGKKKVRRE